MTQSEEAQLSQERAATQPPVVVKKYANRRLYNTESSSYITLDNLAELVRAGRDFVVYDAKSGDDITRGVLTQIIVEEESKGRSMLPEAFLRQLIGFYGGSMQGMVARYLEQTMATFARQQEQVRTAVQQTMGNFLPPGLEEMGRQNMAMMERAMTLFSPFYRPPAATAAFSAEPQAAAQPQPPQGEPQPQVTSESEQVRALREELASVHAQLAAALDVMRAASEKAAPPVSAPPASAPQAAASQPLTAPAPVAEKVTEPEPPVPVPSRRSRQG
jgi:polyhydroxyalkanoate synthesis repressor PhaR